MASELSSSVRARLMLSLTSSRRHSSAEISQSVSSLTMVSRGSALALHRARALGGRCSLGRACGLANDGDGDGGDDEQHDHVLDEWMDMLLAESWRGRICSRWCDSSSCCSCSSRYFSRANLESWPLTGEAIVAGVQK